MSMISLTESNPVNAINALRDLMRVHSIDVYLIPSTDPHNSEYVPDHWQRRAKITCFTGSSGEAWITQEEAFLSTDGRYFLQAEAQLPEAFQLVKQLDPQKPAFESWLSNQSGGLKVGIDPTLINIARAHKLEKLLAQKHQKITYLAQNLVDEVFKSFEIIQSDSICVHDIQYAGRVCEDKISEFRQVMQEARVDACFLNVLDEIAWLLNVRGQDIDYNPLVIGYLYVSQTEVVWFLEIKKLTSQLSAYLLQNGVQTRPYAAYEAHLIALKNCEGIRRVGIDDRALHQNAYMALLAANVVCVHWSSPVIMMKACKHPAEQQGMVRAHERDAVALIEFFAWLKPGVTELEASQKLASFRAKQALERGLSFPAISAYGNHGAIIHYVVTEETDQSILSEQLYLLDSGGQYLDGTTDVTRTIHLGEPTADQKKHYTQVLKGHIALANIVFPEGTTGGQLDVLARQYLWRSGLNYRHGTGHGVGAYLCVHEGPQSISPKSFHESLKEGMIISNEPGYYAMGEYGIRIENLCMVVPAMQTEYGQFFRLETLTLVPYAKRLIDFDLLTVDELTWLKQYYAKIETRIIGQLSNVAKQWVENEIF